MPLLSSGSRLLETKMGGGALEIDTFVSFSDNESDNLITGREDINYECTRTR
jgi:hypothetical protein